MGATTVVKVMVVVVIVVRKDGSMVISHQTEVMVCVIGSVAGQSEGGRCRLWSQVTFLWKRDILWEWQRK